MYDAQAGQIETVKPPQGFALTALILGIVAILSSWVPVLGALLGIAAIIFGAIALKRRQSKGFGLTGLILGALATIVSVIATIALFAFTGNLFDELETAFGEDATVESQDPAGESEEPAEESEDPAGESEEPTGPSETESESDEGATIEEEFNMSSPDPDDPDGLISIPWDKYRTEDAPLSQNAGTSEDPHSIGTRMVSPEWEIVVNGVNKDAADELLALAPDNPPAGDGKRYVLVHVTVNNTTGEPAETRRLDVYYTIPSQIYPARSSKAHAPEPALFEKNLQVTGNFSGYIAFHTKDVDGEHLSIRHDSFPDDQYFAVD